MAMNMYISNWNWIKTLSNNVKLIYMDINSVVPVLKTDDVYADIARDINKQFHTLNYDEIIRIQPLPVKKR